MPARGARVLRCVAASLAAALLLAPPAQAAIAFRGFPAKRERALRSDLARSLFPFAALLDVVVRPRDLPPGVLGLAVSDGRVFLADEAFRTDSVRTFAFLHELSHQIDFQLLKNPERARFYEAAGFGPAGNVDGLFDTDWSNQEAEHSKSPYEQFASAVPLVVWPASRGNVFVREDGECVGWEGGEGCAVPLVITREIVDEVLRQQGYPPLGEEAESAEPVLEPSYVPPTLGPAAPEPALRPPDPGPTPVVTSLIALAPLTGVRGDREDVLRVRLSASRGGLAGMVVQLDYQDEKGWWRLGELRTDRAGEISYRFRPEGWRPTSFRVTFPGVANLTGVSLVVPVTYA